MLVNGWEPDWLLGRGWRRAQLTGLVTEPGFRFVKSALLQPMNRMGRTTIYAMLVIVTVDLAISWIVLKAASVNRWASWVGCLGVAGTLYFGPGGVFIGLEALVTQDE
jgi:hypothetical protein